MIKVIFIFSALLFATSQSYAVSLLENSDQSYAEEFRNLRILLENVKDKGSALKYKAAIEKEIQLLSSKQLAGSHYFNSLSEQDKKLFIKRFQRNRFHCGEVTQVMEERRRILFDPALSEVLADTLVNFP